MPSKLFPHSLGDHPDLRLLVEAGCRAVTLAGSLNLAADLLTLRADLLLFGVSTGESARASAAGTGETRPDTAAREYVESQRDVYQTNRLIRIWAGPTLSGLTDASDPTQMLMMAWYAAFEAERLRLLADLDLRGIIGNFASGTPDPELWLAFTPALDAADRHEGFLGLHTSLASLDYRKIYDDYLTPNEFGNLPLILTLADSLTLEQFIAYDGELQQDNYVLGAALDLAALAGTDIPQRLADHIRASRTLADSQPQPVAVAPEPSPIGKGGVTPPAPLPAPPGAVTAPLPTIAIPTGPETPRAVQHGNLLFNASFETGTAYFHDDTRELAIPTEWQFSCCDSATPLESKQTAPWGKPITALINSRSVAPSDRQRVFAGGAYAWKVCGTASPMWARLSQTVTGLTAGTRYRLTVSLLPDLIVRTHPQLAYAADPLTGEVRLTANCVNLLFDSGWKTGRDVPFGRYTPLALEFTASTERAEVTVEVRGRWPLPLGAWYVDELSLVAV